MQWMFQARLNFCQYLGGQNRGLNDLVLYQDREADMVKRSLVADRGTANGPATGVHQPAKALVVSCLLGLRRSPIGSRLSTM